MKQGRTDGITLIEILATVAIISILVSVVAINFTPARVTSRINSAMSFMESARATATVCTYRASALNAPALNTRVCPQTDVMWPTLPVGWVYGGGACAAFDGTISDGTFTYCARGDAAVVTCTQSGCIRS